MNVSPFEAKEAQAAIESMARPFDGSCCVIAEPRDGECACLRWGKGIVIG